MGVDLAQVHRRRVRCTNKRLLLSTMWRVLSRAHGGCYSSPVPGCLLRVDWRRTVGLVGCTTGTDPQTTALLWRYAALGCGACVGVGVAPPALGHSPRLLCAPASLPQHALSIDMLHTRPALTWKYLREIEAGCRGAKPNAAHEAIAQLQQHAVLGPGVWVLTQNVDGLHCAACVLHQP